MGSVPRKPEPAHPAPYVGSLSVVNAAAPAPSWILVKINRGVPGLALPIHEAARLSQVSQIAQVSRRHELAQRVEVAPRHRPVLLGGRVAGLVGVEQILLGGDQQAVGLAQ